MQPAWSGNDMDGYADDVAAVIEALDMKDVTMIGHSTGAGSRALHRRHGTQRVARRFSPRPSRQSC